VTDSKISQLLQSLDAITLKALGDSFQYIDWTEEKLSFATLTADVNLNQILPGYPALLDQRASGSSWLNAFWAAYESEYIDEAPAVPL